MGLQRVIRRIRGTIAPLSPRHRRWKRFLRSLPLDPDHLVRPVKPPTSRDFIICGAPRTGTTLLTAMLFQPPSIITVMEPWDGMRLPPAELFASLRTEIGQTGTLRRGKLDIPALMEQGMVRWCQEGEPSPQINVNSDFLLGVKWVAYWRYLDFLPETRFLICTRHPFDVINSCNSHGGRLAQGLEYDTAFNRKMNQALTAATRDSALRRILLYNYINERILPFLDKPNTFVVPYHRWFEDPEALLSELSAFLGVRLGLGTVIIQPPKNKPGLSSGEMTLIRDRCKVAEALGYTLNRR